MKKLLVLLLSLVFLISLACPIFASAVQVEYPSNDSSGASYRFVVGTTGGGSAEAEGGICLLTAILYFSWDSQFPSFSSVYNLAQKVVQGIPNSAYGWLSSASSSVLNTVPVTIPLYVIHKINDALGDASISFRVPLDTFALNNLPGYTSLNIHKSSIDFFLTESEYNSEPSSSSNNSSVIASIRDKIRDLFLSVSDGFQNTNSTLSSVIGDLIDSLQIGTLISTVTNGFRDINDRFLDSFKTMGNQLYAIRDRLTDGSKPISDFLTDIGTKIQNGFANIFNKDVDIPSFENDVFDEYDKYIDSLEGTADDLTNTLDSVLTDYTLLVNEFSGALVAFSAIMSAFIKIDFISTMINFSLALGLCATVLGLVPLVTKKGG